MRKKLVQTFMQHGKMTDVQLKEKTKRQRYKPTQGLTFQKKINRVAYVKILEIIVKYVLM